MKCTNCGTEIKPSDRFCVFCGTKNAAFVPDSVSNSVPNNIPNNIPDNIPNRVPDTVSGAASRSVSDDIDLDLLEDDFEEESSRARRSRRRTTTETSRRRSADRTSRSEADDDISLSEADDDISLSEPESETSRRSSRNSSRRRSSNNSSRRRSSTGRSSRSGEGDGGRGNPLSGLTGRIGGAFANRERLEISKGVIIILVVVALLAVLGVGGFLFLQNDKKLINQVKSSVNPNYPDLTYQDVENYYAGREKTNYAWAKTKYKDEESGKSVDAVSLTVGWDGNKSSVIIVPGEDGKAEIKSIIVNGEEASAESRADTVQEMYQQVYSNAGKTVPSVEEVSAGTAEEEQNAAAEAAENIEYDDAELTAENIENDGAELPAGYIEFDDSSQEVQQSEAAAQQAETTAPQAAEASRPLEESYPIGKVIAEPETTAPQAETTASPADSSAADGTSGTVTLSNGTVANIIQTSPSNLVTITNTCAILDGSLFADGQPVETQRCLLLEDPATGYLADNSYLSQEFIQKLSIKGICYAKNEIYAKHGRMFVAKELSDYFNSMPWYQGTVRPEDFSDTVFNEYEVANIQTLVDYENEMGPYMPQ